MVHKLWFPTEYKEQFVVMNRYIPVFRTVFFCFFTVKFRILLLVYRYTGMNGAGGSLELSPVDGGNILIRTGQLVYLWQAGWFQYIGLEPGF